MKRWLRSAYFFLRAHREGLTLAEVIVALTLGVLLLGIAASLISPALRGNANAVNAQIAGGLAKELTDNVRSWANANWNGLLALATSSANPYYLTTASSPFTAYSGSESLTVGGNSYQRYFYVSDVYRDANGNVTTTAAGNNYDPSTKQITIVANFVNAVTTGGLNSWSNTTALPKTLRGSLMTAYNGYLYVVGGYDNSAAPVTNTYLTSPQSSGTIVNWSSTTPLPSGLEWSGGGIYNGYIYAVGGIDKTFQSTSSVFFAPMTSTSSIGNWTLTAALPSALSENAAAFYNGYLYTGGGDTSASVLTSTVYYAQLNANGSISNWSSTTKLPYLPQDHRFFAYNGYLYSMGGQESVTNAATSSIFSAPINSTGSLGSWTLQTSFPSVRAGGGLAAYSSKWLYMTAGFTGTNGASPLSTAVYTSLGANGTINSWTATQSIATGTTWLGSAVSGNYLYEAGGSTGAGGNVYTSTVRYAPFTFTPSSTSQQTYSFYLTRNTNNAYLQSDWSGGSGQSGPATTTNNDFASSTNANFSTAGQITIAPPPGGAGCTQ